MITVLHREGYAQMITILHRGGGSLGTPKSDYVICARPLSSVSRPMFFALIWFNTMLNLQGKTLLHWTLQNSLSLETENPRYPHFEPNTYIQI